MAQNVTLLHSRQNNVTEIVLFQQKVSSFAERHHLFDGAATVIAGISGGADSMAMLDWLVSSAPSGVTIIAAHLNHSLRGAEADADAALVAAAAGHYDIRYVSRTVDVALLAHDKRLSLEEAGRQARYIFFDELCRLYAADAIAVAHHADDQAETVLMRLLRGSGALGLSAMQPKNSQGVIRPFLCVTRAEIESYLHARGISWRDDHTNADSFALRNRIRHQLLHFLKDYNPNIVQRLNGTASLLADDDRCLSEQADTLFSRLAVRKGKEIRFAVSQLSAEPAALASRILRAAINDCCGTLQGVDQGHIERSLALMASTQGGELSLPHGCRIRKTGLILSVSCGEDQAPPDSFTIDRFGRYPLGDGRSVLVEAGEGCASHSPDGDGSCLSVDGEELPFPWMVRPFQPGDRFVPSGMTGEQKVKKYFIDKKVPLADRCHVPLFFCGERLFWIAGYRPAAGIQGSERARMPIRLQLTEAESHGSLTFLP